MIVAKFGSVEGLLRVPGCHLPAALRHGRSHIGAIYRGVAGSASLVAHEIRAEGPGYGQQDEEGSRKHCTL